MNQRITAIVEQGRLRPTVPLDLPDGTELHLIVEPAKAPEPPKPRRDVKEMVAEIIALPTRGGDPNTSRDHDRILYGEGGAR